MSVTGSFGNEVKHVQMGHRMKYGYMMGTRPNEW
jgi:hypothetical protein